MSAVTQNYLERLETRVTRLQHRLAEVGVCPFCLEIPQHDIDAPFSSCRCGTGEDHARAPLQRLQLLEARDTDVLDKALGALVPRMVSKADQQIVRDTLRSLKTPGRRLTQEAE